LLLFGCDNVEHADGWRDSLSMLAQEVQPKLQSLYPKAAE
jgi:hypothetical protein